MIYKVKVLVEKECCWAKNKLIIELSKFVKLDIEQSKLSKDIKLPVVSIDNRLIPVSAYLNKIKKDACQLAANDLETIYEYGDKVVIIEKSS